MTVQKPSGAITGFTLIELLVTVAIIAVLAAILFPVFAKSREKARSAQCMSNAKQIGNGVLLYLQDHDEMFPSCYGGAYLVTLQPYLRTMQVWACPSGSGNYTISNQGITGAATNWGVVKTGLAANGDVMGGWNFATPLPSQKVVAPGSTVLMVDCDVNVAGNSGQIAFTTNIAWSANGTRNVRGWNSRYTSASPTHPNSRLGAKHHDGGNFVYVDGHGKWLKAPPRDCGTYKPGSSGDVFTQSSCP